MEITLRPCPPGFSNINTTSYICAPPLEQRGLVCNITEQTIERKGTVWVSIVAPGNTSNSYLVHDHCPFDYCNISTMKVLLTQPDVQCVFHHSGILCGQCKQNYSAILGTSKCMPCENRWISLLAVFIVAGVVLISFIIYCNVTVSVGVMNGLIIFANIVQVNNPVLFPPESKSLFLSALRYSLSLFIAWLNLDLGIEVCFYEGMTTRDKVWLQLAFPIYIWVLVGIIIIAARHSTRVVRIIGTSAISVLATLFLLSYTKLLRTIMSIFSFMDLDIPDKGTSSRWLLDGNIVMAEGKHIPLLAVGLVFSVFFIIPYTIMLMFAPCIQTCSGTWLMRRRWLRVIFPLLDTYQAPYNVNFRFWTGLLLVIRVALFIAFAINTFGDPNINLLLTVTAVLFLLALNLYLGNAYKSRLLNIMETSFFTNLGILSLWSSFINRSSTNAIEYQLIISCISVGLAFIKFILILCYHVYLILKRKEKLHYFKCCTKRRDGYNTLQDEDEHTDNEPSRQGSINSYYNPPPHTTNELVLCDSLRAPSTTT